MCRWPPSRAARRLLLVSAVLLDVRLIAAALIFYRALAAITFFDESEAHRVASRGRGADS